MSLGTKTSAGRQRERRVEDDVGIELDGEVIESRDLDAVIRAEAAIVLGLAAGLLALDDVRGLVDIEGDDAAVRALFGASRHSL